MSTPAQPPAAPPTPPATPPAPPEGVQPQPPAPPAPPETDWKAEARKWETRAKENAGAAAQLAKIEEASKTEAEKLAERASKAEQTAATAQAEALRWRTAAKHGISDEDAEIFLTGTTEETLTRQAERLATLRAPQGTPAAVAPPGQQTPVTALRPGAMPNPPEPTLPEQIAAAEAAGDWAKASRLKAHQLVQLTENT